MSFKQGLLHARSHIAMILGLFFAVGLVSLLELWDVRDEHGNPADLEFHDDIPAPPLAPLTATERQWAQIAWRYFENNYQPGTGLVNAVENEPSVTMWDTASYLLALICAERLEIISPYTFDIRLSRALIGLGKLELFDGRLPNKMYNTKTLSMLDHDGTPSRKGIGWSAVDLGRLLVPLQIIVWNHPKHTPAVQEIIRHWQWSALAGNGRMRGSIREGRNTVYVQEGRLGYEQYAARGLGMLGLDMSIAGDAMSFVKFLPQYGVDVPMDRRDSQKQQEVNCVVSEPYILDGLEFEASRVLEELAWRVYQVQEQRYKTTGIPTAAGKDHLDQPPYYVYNTVFANGGFWRTITPGGDDADQFKTVSLKVVFGWHTLYRTDYTALLLEKVKNLHDPERGWYAGFYEKTGKPNTALTADTNAFVLESLAVKQFGKLHNLYKEFR